ncbi:MAG: adenosylcobinamide-GDP ribazoletransferase [Lachnospiraceae bacterium]|nr:adenosylcobinamide-GDP ribazoletransferase [Lachnospiraceae bacterium]
MDIIESVLRSFAIAFGTYSKIPMPHFEWKEEDMRYSLCFFPLVGAVIGLLVWGFVRFANWIGLGEVSVCLIGCILPVLVTGGIHLDGFLDVCDARHSYGEREKKLEILKDPHIGAFAMIQTLVCVAVYASAFAELIRTDGVLTAVTEQGGQKALAVFCCGFVLARVFSALSLVCLQPAKENGMLAAFAQAADPKVVQGVLLLELGITVGVMLGIETKGGIFAVLAAALSFAYYAHVSKKEFGGITGDLAGFFVVVCETAMAVALCFS